MIARIARVTALIAALATSLLPHAVARAQTPAPLQMVVEADRGTDTISRHIYGQFMEHLGRGIYDGIWTRNGTGQWHLREDVVQALRKIQVPDVRWPGGCFADYYHWQDGVGPSEKRPTIVNTVWGGVTEDNSFGTDEYMTLIRELGAEPWIVGNVGTGSPREMAEWWEYVNFPGTSPMADLRRANGHDEPYHVQRWGVGNESWGCGGSMTPEYYSNLLRRFATFLRPYDHTRPFIIATGPNGADYDWTDAVMKNAGRMIDGIDLHYYTVVGPWNHKGSATEFDEAQWFTALKKALRMDELVRRHATIMDSYDPRKRVALIVGEWGMWHDVEPGTNPGFLYQQNTLRDAVVASVTLDIFNHHADRVRGANIAQMVNVLQSMILTRGDQMILTPTYYVYDFYTVHHDAVSLPVSLDAGHYTYEGDSIPAVSASASRDTTGRIHITMTNLDPDQARTVQVAIRGQRVSRVSGRILTAATMAAHNTFEQPNAVHPESFDGARLAGETLTVRLPAKSIVVLELYE
jgi:alpha-N-arabinofuranosidase